MSEMTGSRPASVPSRNDGVKFASGPSQTTPAGAELRVRLDNPPAVGAPKNWPWGYLPCGCRNDGYGRHIR